jgi:hypothetical protein
MVQRGVILKLQITSAVKTDTDWSAVYFRVINDGAIITRRNGESEGIVNNLMVFAPDGREISRSSTCGRYVVRQSTPRVAVEHPSQGRNGH